MGQLGNDHLREKIEPIPTHGFEASRILLVPNPIVLSFDVLCSLIRATVRGAAYLVHACSSHYLSVAPKANLRDSLDLDLLELSKVQNDLRNFFQLSCEPCLRSCLWSMLIL